MSILARLGFALVAACLLCGCGKPAPPQGEIHGSTGLVFTERPSASHTSMETEVVWTFSIRNEDSTMSAPARLHISVSYSGSSGPAKEDSLDLAPMERSSSKVVTMRTPYQGLGDYTGFAEILVGEQAVARVFLFFEQCATPC